MVATQNSEELAGRVARGVDIVDKRVGSRHVSQDRLNNLLELHGAIVLVGPKGNEHASGDYFLRPPSNPIRANLIMGA